MIELREQVEYTVLHTNVQTEELPSGSFIATGAFYWQGQRCNYLSVIDEDPERAESIVNAILEHGEQWARYIGRDLAWESERHLRAAEGY